MMWRRRQAESSPRAASFPSCGLTVLLCVLLLACTPRFVPPGPGTAEAQLEPSENSGETGKFVTADGTQLPLRVWRSKHGNADVIVLALHGFNDYSRAFEGLGDYLSDRGITVYAYDQRGFGATEHAGLWPGAGTLVTDLRTAVSQLRRRHADAAIYLLGESMGAAVVLAAAGQNPPIEVDGLILAAPAVWGRETQPWYQRVALWLSSTFVPGLRPSGRGLQRQASDNIEMLRDLGRDPLVLKGARIDALAGLVDLMDEALAAGRRVRQPTLLLYGKKDEIVPREPVERLWRRLPAKERQRYLLYEDGWHLLLRDLQADVVMADIAAWIENNEDELPSGAEVAEPGSTRPARRSDDQAAVGAPRLTFGPGSVYSNVP